jgi:aminoglycoside phosphotransferase (APT) family kinase protein
MVMDRASGAALLSGLDGFAALLRVPVLARCIPNVLAHSMADLHAIDPGLVRSQLTGTGLAAMLDALARGAEACDRPDLSVAAARLTSRESSDPDVICHGDLHPLNLLVDEQDAVTVLDWSAATLAPRTYDVGFTSLLLSEPPLALPERLRPLARAIGRRLAARFVHGYEQCAGVRIVPEALAYFQAVVCLRALVEVCEWEAGGVLAQRVGHPWLTNSVSFARRLSAFSGVDVRSR